MIGTITPLVKVAPKEWLSTSALFAIGGISASSALGVTLGLAGANLQRIVPVGVADTARPAIFAIVVGMAAARELGWVNLGFPERRRSVSRTWWLFRDHRVAAVWYGSALGLGLLTHIAFATFHVLLVWTILYGTPQSGWLVMGTYGAARVLSVVAISVPVARAGRSGERLSRVRQYLVTNRRMLATVNGLSLVLVLAFWLLQQSVGGMYVFG
ncbi:MAG: hypothetical protein ACRDIY_18935 [Chloroflexota bacterium]